MVVSLANVELYIQTCPHISIDFVICYQRFNPGQDKVVLDMDMLYNTKDRNAFCKEWKMENGEEGEDLYKHQQRRLMFRKKIIGPPGPTGTSYFAWLVREKKDGQYKMTDRSLYGARPPFNKIFAKEEKMDGMSEDELAKRVGMTLFDNSTDCNCGAHETEVECAESGIGCIWRPLFESCHPPELIDGSEPICATTIAPTMAPTLPLPEGDTESPTADEVDDDETDSEPDPWYISMFKSREHDAATTESNSTEDSTLEAGDDDFISEPDARVATQSRKLAARSQDPLYETDLSAEQRMQLSGIKYQEEEEQDGHISNIKSKVATLLSPLDGSENLDIELHEEYRRSEELEKELQEEDEKIPIMLEEEMKLKQKISTLFSDLVGKSEANEKALRQEDAELFNLHEEERRYKARIAGLSGENSEDEQYRRKLQAADQGVEKTCDSWNPSIVHRLPTVSNTWHGASLDPESRSHSAMAVSRPRKLHGSFLQDQQGMFSNIFDSSSPLKESWLTSSVPINVPKYAIYQESFHSKPTTLDTSDVNHKTFVNYEDGDSDDYQPLRITFATDHLLSYKRRHKSSHKNRKRSEPISMATITRIESLLAEILPAVSEIWAGALSVLPSVDNIFPFQDTCGEATVPPQHLTQGFPDTDTLIYVTIDGPQCYTDEADDNLVSYATVCSFDQHMRPISANIDVCLNHIDVSFGEVSEEENLRLTSTLTIEVGKVLGLSPSLFHHFRNSETGQPFGSTEKTVTCVNGEEKTLSVPNVLQSSIDLGIFSSDPYFQVITPTVRQVIRNHFDCQTLLGARLSQGGDESSSCFGDSFDSRYHFDDDLASVPTADSAYSLSPLTLALLEDSGWYKASFHKSTVPLFGRGAGCGFVEGDCVGEFTSVLPEYSRGFFCNDDEIQDSQDLVFEYQQPSNCDYTHNHKADCSSFGENESDGFCPMRMENIISCSAENNIPSLSGEVYSRSSRCFVTDTPVSVCLESYCNSVDWKLDIVVDGRVYQCDYEGQLLDLNLGYSVECPRLGVVCPHLVCPANCSGKGVCDYCQDVPQCVCDDPFDETLGCYGDPTLVTVGSIMDEVDQLMNVSEDNKQEVKDDEEEILKHKQRISTLLSKLLINSDEDHEQELKQGEEQISKLKDVEIRYKTKLSSLLPHLVSKGEENERKLQQEDEIIASLDEESAKHKEKITNLLHLLVNKAEENERELQQEDAQISNIQMDGMQHKSEVSSLISHRINKSEENIEELHREDETISEHKQNILLLEAMEDNEMELHEYGKANTSNEFKDEGSTLLASDLIKEGDGNEEKLGDEDSTLLPEPISNGEENELFSLLEHEMEQKQKIATLKAKIESMKEKLIRPEGDIESDTTP